MAFQIVRDDISRVRADVIVNSANPQPLCGGGAEAAIYAAAGFENLLAARKEIGALSVGEVGVTSAFALPAKYVVHTVGPLWNGGVSGELVALKLCYEEALAKAIGLGAKSIAFPLISSGVYGFPKDLALQCAINAFREFLKRHELQILLVVFDEASFEISNELCEDVQNFVDIQRAEYFAVRATEKKREAERKKTLEKSRKLEEAAAFLDADNWNCELSRDVAFCAPERGAFMHRVPVCEAPTIQSPRSLESILKTKEDSFQERLFRLIAQKKLDDVDVYKKANLDRKHFSKIRSNVDYKPKKKTVLALAIALDLNLEETRDLLSRAEFALSPSSRFDLIVTYFITNKKYDIWQINNVLFKYGEQMLGA